MSLNNHGWGMRDMIIFTCILILFLLLANYLISALYDSITPPENNNQTVQTPIVEQKEDEQPIDKNLYDYEYYKNLEVKLRLATYYYLTDTKPNLTQNIEKITLEFLINKGYLSEIYDQYGERQCQGYSNVYQDDDYTIKTYIKCSNYITEGYEGVN